MKNKNIIRIFWGWQPKKKKKKNSKPLVLTSSLKKGVEALHELEDPWKINNPKL